MDDLNQAKEALLQILERQVIVYHASFAKLAGSVTAGVFLSQLFYWTGRGADPEGWIFKTRDEWREETCLTRRQQETARRRLRELGVLEEERRGIPARLYYRANLDKLIELLAAQRQETPSPVPSSRAESALQEDPVPTRGAETALQACPKGADRQGGKRPTNSDITQRIHTEMMDGGVGQFGEETCTNLTEFGISQKVARRLAQQCSPEDITGWLAYARTATGLDDPPAFVVRQLLDGEPAPKAKREMDTRSRYLSGKYGKLLQH